MKPCQMLPVTKLALPCLCLKPLGSKWKVLPPSLPFPGWESSINMGELTPKMVSCSLCGILKSEGASASPSLQLVGQCNGAVKETLALKVQCGVMEIWSMLVHGTPGKKVRLAPVRRCRIWNCWRTFPAVEIKIRSTWQRLFNQKQNLQGASKLKY